MWIKECHQRYNQILSLRTHIQIDPGGLERKLSHARNTMKVGPKELSLIEEDDLWPYPDWWPKLAEELGLPIPLPQSLNSQKNKEKAVKALMVGIKHIEIVSIVLRFIFPEYFGIMSPPVLGILNLVPGRDHVEQYFRYLSELGKLRECYSRESGLWKIADYDMALWTAAHLDWSDGADQIRDEMDRDKEFQEIRLSNLMEGLGSRWGASIREQLLLAKALLKQDHVAAAVIVARCYEQIIRLAGKRATYPIRFGRNEKKVHDQLRELAAENEVQRRGVRFADLDLWNLRCNAVHGIENRETGELREIPKEQTRTFLKGVEKLIDPFKELLPKG